MPDGAGQPPEQGTGGTPRIPSSPNEAPAAGLNSANPPKEMGGNSPVNPVNNLNEGSKFLGVTNPFSVGGVFESTSWKNTQPSERSGSAVQDSEPGDSLPMGTGIFSSEKGKALYEEISKLGNTWTKWTKEQT